MSEKINRKFLNKLRILGIVEAISTLILFGIAMPLKYLGDMPIAVTIAGSIHGVLFMAFVAMCWFAIETVPLTRKLSFTCMIAAVFPFGPFVMDKRLRKLANSDS